MTKQAVHPPKPGALALQWVLMLYKHGDWEFVDSQNMPGFTIRETIADLRALMASHDAALARVAELEAALAGLLECAEVDMPYHIGGNAEDGDEQSRVNYLAIEAARALLTRVAIP